MQKMKLYQLPRASKVKIFPNGESSLKVVTVFAQNFPQVCIIIVVIPKFVWESDLFCCDYLKSSHVTENFSKFLYLLK